MKHIHKIELNAYLSLCLFVICYLIQDKIIRFDVNLDYTEINTQRIIWIFIKSYDYVLKFNSNKIYFLQVKKILFYKSPKIKLLIICMNFIIDCWKKYDYLPYLIDFQELYSIETVIKLLDEKYVLVSNEYHIENIINYYKQFYLIERGENKFSHIYGFPIRRSLDPKIRAEIRKLLVFFVSKPYLILILFSEESKLCISSGLIGFTPTEMWNIWNIWTKLRTLRVKIQLSK